MQIVLFYLLIIVGVVGFSFSFWHRIREDYTPDQICSSTILVLVGGLLGWVIFDRWLPQFSFWGILGGSLLFGVYAVRKIGLKLYESGDSAALGIVWFSLCFYLAHFVKDGFGDRFFRLVDLVPSLVSLLAFHLYFKNYRRFSWYPSGKIGFIAGSIGVLYFFTLALVAIYRFAVISFSSSIIDALVSLLLSVFFAGVVYSRSGRKFVLIRKKK
ncbi:MAG: hypothetical protein AAB599_04010 [Patescibacteria group bacterium]